MKKLVFTAIAMIAFSGASMANTKEVKKESLLVAKTSTNETIEKGNAALVRPCKEIMIDVYETIMDGGCGEIGSGCGGDNAGLLNYLMSSC